MKAKIDAHLTTVLATLMRNPLLFVSEGDIHKWVMCELMKICELDLCHLHNTNCTIGRSPGGRSKEKYKTSLLHSEYGHANLPRARSDLVILNEKDVARIDDPLDLKAGGKWLTPDYIFEFGTEKSAGSAAGFRKHLDNDFHKLSHARKAGYLIHIQRDFHKSALSTQAHKNNRQKYAGYEKAFRAVRSLYSSDKIKTVVALINIGTKNRIIRGKVELITDPGGAGKFVKVNLHDLGTEIAKLLA